LCNILITQRSKTTQGFKNWFLRTSNTNVAEFKDRLWKG
jgi:hypothetical protein